MNFEKETVAKVIKAYLVHGLSHRNIQKEILNLPAPQKGGGFKTMEILHAYNLRKEQKHLLENKSINEALNEVKDKKIIEAIRLILDYDNELTQFDIYNQISINNSDILSDEELDKLGERKPEKSIKSDSKRYKTNPRISKSVIAKNYYKCQYDDSHLTFNDKRENQFVEAHHLIPMAFQDNYEKNLDRKENITTLCPNCHRAVHLGNKEERNERLKLLFHKSKEQLNRAGIYININQLLYYY